MASIVEQIINAVFADPLLAGVVTATGRRETETNAAANRIVAVPLGAPEIVQPDRPGDAKDPDRGRILLVRRFQIDWYCHGAPDVEGAADFTNAENLFLKTIVAARNVLHNSVRFSDEKWDDQQEGNDSLERFGTLIIFRSTVQIPIYESRAASGQIVNLTATPQIATTLTELDQTVTIDQGTPP